MDPQPQHNIYASPEAAIQDHTNSPIQPYTTKANFGWRILAYLIDSILLLVVSQILGFFISLIMVLIGASRIADMLINNINEGNYTIAIAFYFIIIFLSVLPYWLYGAIMESSKVQGTLGHLAVGIKVTDAQGNRIGFWRASVRTIAEFLSFIMLLLGYFWMLWDRDSQTLHDKISGCHLWKK